MIARVLLCLLVACAALCPQVIDQQEILILSRIKALMKRHLDGMPNFTCLETIERFQRAANSPREDLIDVVRLEVAFVEGKEMFAWPGSSQFEDRELRQIVSTGAFGTGAFALHARAVFLGDGTTFTFRGEEILNGVKTWRFDLYTPQFRSGYYIRNPQRKVGANAAYHGSFWANQATSEVMRLEIVTEDIPKPIQIVETTDRLDYQTVKVGSRLSLLPLRSEVRLRDDKGVESINRTRLSRCKEFSGESTISFEDIAESTVADSAQRKPLALPLGLQIELALDSPIEHGEHAVGDKIQATVRTDVRTDVRHHRDTLIPKGSIATGRILRMQRELMEEPVYSITLKFDQIQGKDFVAPLSLRLLRTDPSSAIPLDLLRRRYPTRKVIEVPVADPNGFLRFTDHLKLPRGFVTIWETQEVGKQ